MEVKGNVIICDNDEFLMVMSKLQEYYDEKEDQNMSKVGLMLYKYEYYLWDLLVLAVIFLLLLWVLQVLAGVSCTESGTMYNQLSNIV